ncbi:hypothetical protein COLO4_21249 [Corchorus olitorius]|uniref:Uncharacterized protein n=1 Tax=Corchorus olitorius TaxID=93759 RepID=A0A1R3IUQ1_9ROSI|nr:hypothetical protein COLO4_21249 [Corchorus olitorius]
MSELDNALTAEDLNPFIQQSTVDDDGNNNPGWEEHGSTATGRGKPPLPTQTRKKKD